MIAPERPPVATTLQSYPSSSTKRSSIPSSMQACPYTIPLCMQSTVFLPMTLFGASSGIAGSWDAFATRESSEAFVPGMIVPPI